MSADDVSEAAFKALLRELKLPSVGQHSAAVAARADAEGWTFLRFLKTLLDLEVEERRVRRVERLQKCSGLPLGKTLETLDLDKLPAKVRRQVATLCEGSFVERADNVLAFGLPGRGKTHALCAILGELVKKGHSVLFVPAFRLVQRLLVAKRGLALDRELRLLDAYDAVLVDDIGYVQQDRDEMEVLFTFLAHRYERRSVLISSNLVFSQWDRIFKDPMTTAAAIDRTVHHAIILEMTGPSIRSEQAIERLQAFDAGEIAPAAAEA